jgi:hypothetical protein
MWRCVVLVLTDVSEERIASIFRVEKSTSEEPVWPGGCRLSHHSEITIYIGNEKSETECRPHGKPFFTLKMEAIRSSETSVNTRTTQYHIPEDDILHSHRFESLKSYISIMFVSITKTSSIEKIIQVLESFLR